MANETNADLKRNDLIELYKIAVEEYRFQTKLNTDRSNFYLTYNAAILTAGIAVIKFGEYAPYIAPFIFLFGACSVIASMLAIDTAHSYYRTARNNKRTLENSLGTAGLGLASTPSLPAGTRRWFKATTTLYFQLLVLCAIDIMGFAYALYLTSHLSSPVPSR